MTQLTRRAPMAVATTLIGLALLLVAGCGGGSSSSGSGSGSSSSSSSSSSSGSGSSSDSKSQVSSGTQGVPGAQVVAYAASLNPGDAPTELGAAVTDNSGHFQILFSSTPGSGQLVYLTARGGYAGNSSVNRAIGLMTVAGIQGSTLAPVAGTVNINELTTVASTAALKDYIHFVDCSTIANNSQSGTCLSLPGAADLAARAGTVNNLVNVTTGQASDFLAGQASSSPIHTTLEKLDTLASVLAGCVNASGAGSTACTKLFGATLKAPDTLQAAVRIAAWPGVNVKGDALFSLLPAPAVYAPVLTAAPTGWTVAGRRFAYVANQTDNTISGYRLSTVNGAMVEISGSPFAAGTAPVSVTVAPNGRFAYAANNSDNDVSAYTIDPVTGTLTQISGSPFAAGVNPKSVAVGPGGAFAYVANSGDNDVSVYTINPVSGALAEISGSPFAAGANPSSVTVGPGGAFAYVANSGNNDVSAYTIDFSTGALTDVAGSSCGTGLPGNCFAAGDTPSSVTVDPSGAFAYVANNGGGDVSVYTIDAATGALTPITGGSAGSCGTMLDPDPVNCVSAAGTPQSVTVDPSGQFVYVANNSSNNVSGYAIDAATGTLTQLTFSPFTAGSGPVSVTVDPSGQFVYAVDNDNGRVSAYTLDPATGNLTAINIQAFGAGPNPVSVAVDPSGRFAYVADSLTGSPPDAIWGLTIDGTTGVPTTIGGSPFAAGSGPQSVTVDPGGQFVYVANNGSNDVSAYTIDGTTGAPSAITGAPFAAGSGPQSVTVDPSGQFAYVANNGGHSVSVYTIDAATGALSEIGGSPFAAGSGPFSVTVDPGGQFAYVANSGGNDVSAYTIGSGGALTPVSGSACGGSPSPDPGNCFAADGAPRSVTVDPSGQFAYVANSSTFNVSVYTIDGATGALTAISGSPFGVFTNPSSVTIDPSGQFVYLPYQLANSVGAFTLDSATGALTQIQFVSPNDFFTGAGPRSVVTTP